MLLAFDLDKTIVREDFVLPDEIVQALRRAAGAGHQLTILTGRPPQAMQAYLEQLEVRECYSANHGAYVVGRGGAVLRRQRIDKAHVCALLGPYCDHPGVEFSCIVDDVLYVKNPDDERWRWAHTANRRLERYHGGLELYADKIVFSANGETEALRRLIAERHPDFIQYPWNDGYLEIVAAEADKGSALKLLAGLLGYGREEVVAFGDGPNDASMLEWAGRGIAVGPHACAGVLAAADEHIAAPEELGVARWLEANVF